jgi:hypothetical protein
MMFSEYVIPVPGTWARGVALLDLETRKVPAPAGFRMRNGEPLRQRWSVAMAGIARGGVIFLVDDAFSEEDRLAGIGERLAGAPEIRYAATREFDEMVLRGRFTNARRAHAHEPFYPAMPGAELARWRNVRFTPDVPRGADVASRDVPAALARGDWEPVAVHLLRDVAELILTANPDAECRAWCLRVLADYAYALNEICGEE